jgi:hypothetical protein
VGVERTVGTRRIPDARLAAAAWETRWLSLADEFLPIHVEGLPWRASRRPEATDPDQGWKLHVSATILSACEVVSAVAPLLAGHGALFKAPATLRMLQELNCGLIHGYSQVGKFMTIYPRSEADAVELASELHRLTRGLPAPRVPYDVPYARSSCVHYRYGSFIGPDGDGAAPTVRTPQGEDVPDRREAGQAVPAWAADPFGLPNRGLPRRRRPTALKTTYRAYEALSRRGKGGVYRALDLSVAPARLSVLKEGRRNGEVDWEGRDGYDKIRREALVLRRLRTAGVPVPEVFGTFVAGGNSYLAMEALEGTNLHELAADGLSTARALDLSVGLAELVAQIHAAGWVWNDCKPLNVVVAADGQLRPLDFESAARTGGRIARGWGSAAYLPPEVAGRHTSAVGLDLHALGVSIWQLHTGRLPKNSEELLAPSTMAGPVNSIVRSLTSADPGASTSATQTAYLLHALGHAGSTRDPAARIRTTAQVRHGVHGSAISANS